MARPHIQGANALTLQSSSQSGKLTRKIGGTTYIVSYFFSQTARETLDDKIVRLITNEELTR